MLFGLYHKVNSKTYKYQDMDIAVGYTEDNFSPVKNGTMRLVYL